MGLKIAIQDFLWYNMVNVNKHCHDMRNHREYHTQQTIRTITG